MKDQPPRMFKGKPPWRVKRQAQKMARKKVQRGWASRRRQREAPDA